MFVPSFVPSFVCFSSLWPTFTLTVHINALKVYMEGKNICNWNCNDSVKNSDFIDLTNFEVGLYFRDRCALFGSEAPGAPDVSGHDHFGTECRSKRQFGSLICYS